MHGWTVGRRWTLLVLVVGLLLGASAGPSRAGQEPANGVQLTIDYGDGVQKVFTRLSCEESTTVLEIMNRAQQHPRGIQFKYRGRGALALLTQIDDVQNQGGGADKRNWIFSVNGKLATVGFGAQKVKPGDRISWDFSTYQASR